MPTANARKGSETERMVARYLREHGWPEADRRLREGRADDQGDIDGVPLTVIQVKYVAANRLPAWVNDTIKQRDHAKAPLCLLVVRTKFRTIGGWDAYMPGAQLGMVTAGSEREAWTWIRMDLDLAVEQLAQLISLRSTHSAPSLRSTGSS